MIKRLAKSWAANFMVWESAAVTLLAWSYLAIIWEFPEAWLVGRLEESQQHLLFATIAGVAGSVFGFAVTALSILLGFAGHEALKIVRKSAHYGKLWGTINSTIKFLALVTCVSILELFTHHREALNFTGFVAIYLGLIALARLGRTLWILESMVDIVVKEAKSQPVPGMDSKSAEDDLRTAPDLQ